VQQRSPFPCCNNIIHGGVRKKRERKHILCFNAAEIGQQQQHLIHQHLETPRPGITNGKGTSPKRGGRLSCGFRTCNLAPSLPRFLLFLLTAIVAVGCFYRLYRLQFSGLSAIFTTHFEVCFVCHKTNE